METKYLDAKIKKYEDWAENGVIKYTEKLELIELKAIKEQLLINSVVVPKGTLCDCENPKRYYCLKTGGDRCRKCKKLL